MKRTSGLAVLGFVGCGLIACSGSPESGPSAESESAMAIGQLTLNLVGDGHALRLDGAPANKSYRATYPATERAMTVSVEAGGRLDASCQDATGSVPCEELPFFASWTNTGTTLNVSVRDIYGAIVLETQVPRGDGSGSKGVPGGGTSEGTGKTGSRNGSSEPPNATWPDAGGSCNFTKDQYCAVVDKLLADRGSTATVDCSLVSDNGSYSGPRASQRSNVSWGCMSVTYPGLSAKSNPQGVDEWSQLLGCSANQALLEMNVFGWAESARQQLYARGVCGASPLVLDLAGDGIDLTSLETGVSFDLLGTGERVRTAWIKGDDALLVFDWNGNGRVDDATELFGNFSHGAEFDDGFQPLAELDANGDGRVDARDPQFAELLAWTDTNHDGASSPSELTPLADLGVRELEVKPARVTGPSSFDAHGNEIPLVAGFVRVDGRRSALVDAFFRFRP